jgi:hypothetical protein
LEFGTSQARRPKQQATFVRWRDDHMRPTQLAASGVVLFFLRGSLIGMCGDVLITM